MKVYTLARYLDTGREMGGPEEGGWSYATARREATWTFGTQEQCENLRDAMSPHDTDDRVYYDIKEWDADGTVDDPAFPTCHFYDQDTPQVPASVDTVFPPYLPAVGPHYC